MWNRIPQYSSVFTLNRRRQFRHFGHGNFCNRTPWCGGGLWRVRAPRTKVHTGKADFGQTWTNLSHCVVSHCYLPPHTRDLLMILNVKNALILTFSIGWVDVFKTGVVSCCALGRCHPWPRLMRLVRPWIEMYSKYMQIMSGASKDAERFLGKKENKRPYPNGHMTPS